MHITIPLIWMMKGVMIRMADEKNFENRVKAYLRESGCWFLKYWGGAAYTKSGIPDLLVCCRGRFMGVEIKAPGGKPTDLQIYNLRRIDTAGGLAILLYPKDYDLFKRLVEDTGNKKLYEVLKSKWKHFENIIKEKETKGMEKERITGTESGNTVVKPEESAVTQAGTVDYNYPDIIRTALLKTGREGMVDLIGFMGDVGFFDAPASGGNHSHEKGGLAAHTANVMMCAEKIGVALLGGAGYNEVQNSVVIAAALHDLGKCGDYGKQMYVPNMIKDGKPTKADPVQKFKQSEAKPWKRNPDLLPLDHATRSIKLATLYIDLTEEEEYAIRYHDGLYDTANYGVKGHETRLYMILHWADMWASKVIEGDSGDNSEE